MFQKVNSRAGLSDGVAQALLEQISNGNLPAGAKLPSEAVLAEQFGISRAVVREAMAQLKSQGVVESRQGSGVYVSPHGLVMPLRIDPGDVGSLSAVLQLLDVRRALEAEAAEQAAIKRTARQLEKIENALAEISHEVAKGNDGVLADVAFHRTIAQAAGNPFLLNTLRFLNQYLEAAVHITRNNEAQNADFARQVHEEHQALVDAIRAGDPVSARHMAQTHLYNAGRRLKQSAQAAANLTRQPATKDRKLSAPSSRATARPKGAGKRAVADTPRSRKRKTSSANTAGIDT